MNKRSALWRRKKLQLDHKEEELKHDLEEVTDNFESSVKATVKVTLITGGVLLASYGLYKLLSSSDKKEAPVTRETKSTQPPPPPQAPSQPASSGFSIKTLIIERLVLAIIKYLGTQLTVILNKKMGLEEVEEDEET